MDQLAEVCRYGDGKDSVSIRAYLVDAGGEDGGTLYFADTRGQAKAQAANDAGTDITGIESCVRKPQYDQYAPGPVPVHVLLADGWWFECSGCGQQIYDEDELFHFDEPCDSEHIIERDQIWCCQACKDTEEIREAERKIKAARRRRQAIAAFRVMWPEVLPSRVIDFYNSPCRVDFRIPGAQEPVQWYVGSETVLVLPADLPAWYRFEDSLRVPIACWEDDGGAVRLAA